MKTTAFLGIDVSKGYADFLLLGADKTVLEQNFRLDDNAGGRLQLKNLLSQWFKSGLTEIFCGVESTGGYENNWYDFLRQLSDQYSLSVARLNPRGVKAVSEAVLTRTITDAVSAYNIALYLMSFPEKVEYKGKDYPEGVAFKEGRQHYVYVRMQQKQKVQFNNQLEKLLYNYYPEVLVYCRHGIPSWLLRLLVQYPCGSAVVKAGAVRLLKIKGIGESRVQALIKKSSVSQQSISKQIQHVIAVTSREILHKEDLIDQEKQYLAETFSEHEEVKLLSTIKGVGVDTAIIAMLQIEDINRFDSAKKLAAYFGVHPTFKQSGDGKWGAHMSKKGRPELRAALYMSALSGMRCNNILKQLYARFRAKGMKHYQAMGVVMHKLLRMIYGVLKNKQPYNEQTDQDNVNRSKEKQAQTKEKKNENIKQLKQQRERYRKFGEDAPISRIAAQEIKKQTAS